MTDAGTRFFYEFGDFRLDPQQRVLMSGAEARPIALVPKAFETLLYLLERRGELLGKNSLLKAIWPNVVVEENSLNQTISAIRRALGERAAWGFLGCRRCCRSGAIHAFNSSAAAWGCSSTGMPMDRLTIASCLQAG